MEVFINDYLQKFTLCTSCARCVLCDLLSKTVQNSFYSILHEYCIKI